MMVCISTVFAAGLQDGVDTSLHMQAREGQGSTQHQPFGFGPYIDLAKVFFFPRSRSISLPEMPR